MHGTKILLGYIFFSSSYDDDTRALTHNFTDRHTHTLNSVNSNNKQEDIRKNQEERKG